MTKPHHIWWESYLCYDNAVSNIFCFIKLIWEWVFTKLIWEWDGTRRFRSTPTILERTALHNVLVTFYSLIFRPPPRKISHHMFLPLSCNAFFCDAAETLKILFPWEFPVCLSIYLSINLQLSQEL